MPKLHECESYPCWEYRNWNLKLKKSWARRKHSSHGFMATGLQGYMRWGTSDYSSLIHKGKKRRGVK